MQSRNEINQDCRNYLSSDINNIQKLQRQALLQAIGFYIYGKSRVENLTDWFRWVHYGLYLEIKKSIDLEKELVSQSSKELIEILQEFFRMNSATNDYSLNTFILETILENKDLFSLNIPGLNSQISHPDLRQLIIDLNINGPEYLLLVAKLYESKNLPEAKKYYEKAASSGSYAAQRKLLIDENKLFTEAQQWNNIGVKYHKGENCERNHIKAKICYEQALEINPNYLESIYNSILIYNHEINENKNPPKYELHKEPISSDDMKSMTSEGRSILHLLADLPYCPLWETEIQNAAREITEKDNTIVYSRDDEGKTPFYKLSFKDPYNILNILRPVDFFGINEKKLEISNFLEGIKENPGLEQHLLLIAGPPGVGKTEIARSIVKKLDYELMEFPSSSKEDKYRGQSEFRIIEHFSKAMSKRHPVCLFIDEIDSILPNTENLDRENASYKEDVTNTFQNQLDQLKDKKVVLLGTTNYLDNIKPAIKSRAGTAVIFDLPDRAARKLIIEDLLRLIVLEPNSSIIQKVTDATSGWSPRQLKSYIDKVRNKQKNSSLVLNDQLFETCFEDVRKELERPKKGHAKMIAPKLNTSGATMRAMPLSEDLIRATNDICKFR